MLVMYGMPCWKVANCPGTDHMSRLLLDLAKDFDVAKCMGTFLVVVSDFWVLRPSKKVAERHSAESLEEDGKANA